MTLALKGVREFAAKEKLEIVRNGRSAVPEDRQTGGGWRANISAAAPQNLFVFFPAHTATVELQMSKERSDAVNRKILCAVRIREADEHSTA